jgi:hypothetical protein
MLDKFKPYLFSILLIVVGGISIAISVWQYQVKGDGDLVFTFYPSGEEVNFEYLCNHFPYTWMRPFKLYSDGQGDSVCGYSAANTGYRLALACLSIIAGIWMIFHTKIEGAMVYSYWFIWAMKIFWFAALLADIIAIIQGSKACNNGIAKYGGGFDCGTAQYGITIALDALNFIIMFYCWRMAAHQLEHAEKTRAAATSHV